MKACPACFSTYAFEAEFCGLDGQRLQEFERDPLLGRVLMKYRIEELIGTGAVGCVYRATDLTGGSEHAIKLLLGEQASDKRAVERFRREAEATSRMNHPNIIRITDFGTAPSGLTYMVMELLHGRALDSAMSQDGRFTPERAARVVTQLAAGLAEAHRLGYVHRDLKPGNVMLLPVDAASPYAPEQVKILDFGIVRGLAQSDGDSRLTRPGYVVGTPQYMAPEQIDQSAIGPQTDVYALGCILYEMLSGRPPFTGSVESVLARKLTRDPEPLPPAAGELGPFTLRLLARNPEERPQSALQVSAELHRLSLSAEEGHTVLLPPPWMAPTDVVPKAAAEDPTRLAPRGPPVDDLLDPLTAQDPRLRLDTPPLAPSEAAVLEQDTTRETSGSHQTAIHLDRDRLIRAVSALGASSPGVLARPAEVVDLRTLSGGLALPAAPSPRTRWELVLALGLSFGLAVGTIAYLARRPAQASGALPAPPPEPERALQDPPPPPPAVAPAPPSTLEPAPPPAPGAPIVEPPKAEVKKKAVIRRGRYRRPR